MNLFERAAKKVSEPIKKALEPQTPKMSMCMMGARGVGKTSVLTSMFYNLNDVNSNSNLQLTTRNLASSPKSTDNTTMQINEKHEELLQMFRNTKKGSEISSAGIAASYDTNQFYFQFGLKGTSVRIDLDVKDFPGEYIHTNPEGVIDFISESNAIVIAIDSPYLMEENGRFADEKNGISVITDFFHKCFEDLKDDKLIMLVPLKCEKYYQENRMDELTSQVERQYQELIAFLSSASLKSRVAVVIAPILTVGEVVFSHFQTDECGAIQVFKNNNVPKKAIYHYTKDNARYSPLYCEQPLSYLLSFIVKLYEREKSDPQQKGFLQSLLSFFKIFPDNPTLLFEIKKFSKQRIVDQHGYKILQGHGKV